MALHITIPLIDAALGGSVIYEEYKGDFAVARRIADAALATARTTGDPSQLADALLACGIVRLLQGEPLAALCVYELMGLRLDAELVVLSACRTAQGETTNGNEVLGLTRGLLAAGARAAVVSLWPVDDLATSLLMGHFYRRIRAGDAPATALRAAQHYLRGLSEAAITAEFGTLHTALQQTGAGAARDVVAGELAARHLASLGASVRHNDYSHPHYWAPFVVVGG